MISWLKTNAIVLTTIIIGTVGSYNASQAKIDAKFDAIELRVDNHDHVLAERTPYLRKVDALDNKVAELAPDLKGLIAVMHSIDKRMAADSVRNTVRDKTQQEIKANQVRMQANIQDIKIRMTEK